MVKPKPVSQRASTMPRSAIREIMALAAGRDDVIHLEVGEPDFTTPSHIVEGACDALHQGWTKYTSNVGLPTLRHLVAERMSKRNHITIDSERIAITVGAVGALYTAVGMIADAGDKVLVPDPGWPPYSAMCHAMGIQTSLYKLRSETRYQPDFDEIEAMIGPDTKAIILNTPGNPTGAVFDQATMERFGQIADKTGLYLISDEIYEDIVFDGEHVSCAGLGLDDRVLVVSGVSKSYAMTGWRIGFLLCPPETIHLASVIQEPVVSCAPTVSQKAAEIALSGPQECVSEGREIFRRRRDIVTQVLGDADLLAMAPQGAFYALVRIRDRHTNSTEFAKALLRERGVATVPGLTFGPSCDDTVRIAFTASDADLRIGVERLRDYILGNSRDQRQ